MGLMMHWLTGRPRLPDVEKPPRMAKGITFSVNI
jgi:hypothetical protein